MTLPPRALNEVQRILDAEARRLLAEQLNTDATGAASLRDHDARDDRSDERTAPIERQRIPVRGSDDDSGAAAA